MSDCCTPRGYERIFSERSAWRQVKRFRSKGLDRTSRRVVDALKDLPLEGRTLLEVGGGVGTIQVELLRAGLARAISIELTPTYEGAARDLLRAEGLEDRVQRRVMDFAEAATEVETADFVVLNRVICCYPDMPKLAGAAASHARERLVLSFPKDRWWTRVVVAIANLPMRLAQSTAATRPMRESP